MVRMAISLEKLIHQRMQDLGITRSDLVRRMGYANVAKGCRRIDQICCGHVEMAKNLRVELSQGLEVRVEVVDKAKEVTRTEQIAAEDKAYRESFKPHAVMLTEETVPSQITLYAMTGGARHRIIRFEDGSAPETHATQAQEALPAEIPFFGPPIGSVVNYSPDFALKFSKESRLTEMLNRAFRVGQLSVTVAGKKINEGTLSTPLKDSPSRRLLQQQNREE